jgi:ABC-type branched-subunit amino acid transport system permease subunit
MSEALSGFVQRARTDRGWWVAGAVIAVGLAYPFLVEYLQDTPVIGDFVPGTSSMVVMMIFTMMALGLNVVVGYAGLLDLGYVAFYAAGAYVAGWLASLHFESSSSRDSSRPSSAS